jgi:hypothetical protein
LSEIDEFNFDDEDYYAISIAQNTAYSFLKYPHIEPKQVIGLGNALYALERLPMITRGVRCEFGLVYRSGNEELNEMRYINFRISEDIFEICEGGSVYDPSVGGDSYSNPGWCIEANGYRNTECQLWDIEDKIKEYINLGAKITVEDESFIECEKSQEQDNSNSEEKLTVYKDNIIDYVAEEACKKTSEKVISSLQKMTEGKQSGDDSPLENVWDEICVQVQYEQSFWWKFYLDTIRSTIQIEVKRLNVQIKKAIWLQTEEGIYWSENDEDVDFDFCEEDIVNHVLNDYVLVSAGNWTNEQIEEYLDNRF